MIAGNVRLQILLIEGHRVVTECSRQEAEEFLDSFSDYSASALTVPNMRITVSLTHIIMVTLE